MKRALQQLNNLDNMIKIDGQKIFNFNERTIFITKGDQKSAPIAAASILAKCFRDDLLKNSQNNILIMNGKRTKVTVQKNI